MKRRMLGLVMALVMALTLAPVTAFATVLHSGTCGAGLEWTLDSDGVLTVTGSGPMYDYDYDYEVWDYNAPWREYRLDVKKAVISAGVTAVGNNAFLGCSQMTQLSLPAGLTRIGAGAFSNCSSLPALTLPQSLTTIGAGAFSGCESVSRWTVPGGVTAIADDTFSGCGIIQEMVLPENLTTIGTHAFAHCLFKALVLPPHVQTIPDYAFEDCLWLEKITLPEDLTSIGIYAFHNCGSLTELTLPAGVTTIGEYAFSECGSLEAVTFSTGLTTIGSYAFHNCRGLKDGVFLSTQAPGIGEAAFYNCSFTAHYPAGDDSWTAAKSGDYSGNITWQAEVPDSGGKCGPQLTWALADGTLTITGTGAMDDFSGEAGWQNGYEQGFAPWHWRRRAIESVSLPADLTSLGAGALMDCDRITEVEIPSTVTAIGENAFTACRGLTELALPDGLTAIGSGAFSGCTGLTKMTVPQGVTVLEPWTFSGCEFTAITLPDDLTGIGDNAFAYCSSLKSITVPAGVTALGEYAFGRCTALKRVTFLGHAPETIAEDAFADVNATVLYDSTDPTWEGKANRNYGSMALNWRDSSDPGGETEWTLADGVLTITGTGKMDDYAELSGASTAPWAAQEEEIRSVVIGEGITSVGDRAFFRCYHLQSVTLPESVTAIGQYAFYESGLQRITLPAAVTAIGDYAFERCQAMTAMIFLGHAPTFANTNGSCHAFPGGSDLVGYYPQGDTTWLGIGDRTGFPIITWKMGLPRTEGTWNWTLTDGVLTVSGTGDMKDFSSWGDNAAPWNSRKSEITKAVVESGITYVGDHAFYGCDKLTSVTVAEGVTAVGISAFSGCSKLTHAELPQTLTIIGADAFSNCTALSTLHIPTSMRFIGSGAFAYCRNLHGAAIPDGVTCIDTYTFQSCTGMLAVHIPDSVKIIGDYAFNSCTALPEVELPDGLTQIRSSAFGGCSKLREITVPDGVTELGDSAFSNCTALVGATLGSGVRTIGSDAFYKCTALEKVKLPNSLVSIESRAFWDSGVTMVVLPETVTNVGDNVFLDCKALTDVVFRGHAPAMGEDPLRGVTAAVCYPAADDTWTEDVRDSVSFWNSLTWVAGTVGDLTGGEQGKRNVEDMQCLFAYLSTGAVENPALAVYPRIFAALADVNGDDAVNILDYQALYQIVN